MSATITAMSTVNWIPTIGIHPPIDDLETSIDRAEALIDLGEPPVDVSPKLDELAVHIGSDFGTSP